MFRNNVINAPTLIAGVWNTVKGWLDLFVQQKIAIVGYGDPVKNLLLQYVDPDVLELDEIKPPNRNLDIVEY